MKILSWTFAAGATATLNGQTLNLTSAGDLEITKARIFYISTDLILPYCERTLLRHAMAIAQLTCVIARPKRNMDSWMVSLGYFGLKHTRTPATLPTHLNT